MAGFASDDGSPQRTASYAELVLVDQHDSECLAGMKTIAVGQLIPYPEIRWSRRTTPATLRIRDE
jgi:hypothetical protein